MKQNTILPLLSCAGLLAGAVFLHGQVFYDTAGMVYSEDFGSLNPSFDGGTPHPWTDNSTVPAFYASLSEYRATNNPTITSAMYNLRSGSSATDKSLGSVPGLGSGTIYVGLRLVNDTGTTLTSFDLGYIGQQWRNSGNETASELAVDWRVGTGTLTDGIWSNIGDATFTALKTGGAAENFDGNDPANQVSLNVSVTDSVAWAPGEELWIRWGHENHGGTNHGLAIDDVSFAAIPEPAHIGALFAGIAGLLLMFRRKRRG